METIPLDCLCLLDLEGRPTSLKEQAWAVELSVAMRMGGTLSKMPSLMNCLTTRQKDGIVLENANPQTGPHY